MAAGIQHGRGEILVTMDGDLQNDPADIEHFLAKMAEGALVDVGGMVFLFAPDATWLARDPWISAVASPAVPSSNF